MAMDAALRDEKSRQKWAKIMTKGVETVLEEQRESFARRARRGIPDEYRYEFTMHYGVNYLDGVFGKHA